MMKETNQCDGCQRGLPIIAGDHYKDGHIVMGCTKPRYEESWQDRFDSKYGYEYPRCALIMKNIEVRDENDELMGHTNTAAVTPNEIKLFISTEIENARKEEESRWLNQSANDHDQRIRECLADQVDSLKTFENYDIMVCSKCQRFIRERFSHNSEDGFSTCCGKKLERKQGTKMEETDRNYLLSEIIELIRKPV